MVDSVPLVHRIVDDHRKRAPSATIAAELPDQLRVRGNGHLSSAVNSLVENAVEHNPAPEPFVRMSVLRFDPGWAEIRVEDDAPKIPADERDILTGDLEATQTHHGSGLGLWLAKWVAESYGGELLFDESDRGGNSVRIRLPKA
ncbi:ATP-binding protein [Halobellus sp. EA9]|uniref:ATP-binding protein n=1 Tax=Halobellus sp. EA9 TaxID=3421647 RepID=UPI003EBA1FB5